MLFGLKKYLPLDLVQLTILLSLLRIDPDAYLELQYGDVGIEDVSMGSSAAFIRTNFHNLHHTGYDRPFTYPHTKSLDLTQRTIFHRLNQLGRYNRYNDDLYQNVEFATYLLDGQGPSGPSRENKQSDDEPNNVINENAVDPSPSPTQRLDQELLEAGSDSPQPQETDAGLSKEDMDLIEILLRQDVDLGVTRDVWEEESNSKPNGDVINEQTLKVKIKLWRSMFLVLSWWRERGGTLSTMPLLYEPFGGSGKSSSSSATPGAFRNQSKEEEEEEELSKRPPFLGCDPWAGLNYTIDSETGEHVVLEDEEDLLAKPIEDEEEEKVEEVYDRSAGSPLTDFEGLPEDLGNIFDDINLCLDDESTQFVDLKTEGGAEGEDRTNPVDAANSLIEQLKDLEDMIQTTQLHPHPVHHQMQTLATGRTTLQVQRGVPTYIRSMTMEQRWPEFNNVPVLNNESGVDVHHHHLHHHHHHHNMSMGIHLSGSMAVGGGSGGPGGHHIPTSPPTNYTNMSPYASLDNRTSVLIQNATLPPPIAELNNYHHHHHHNELGVSDGIGAAVVTSMSALTNGSDLLGVENGHNASSYAMDVMMFPPNVSHPDSNNATSSGNGNNSSSDGFLSAIINEDDLQLMEMAMNDNNSTDPLNSSSSFSYFLSNHRKLPLDNGTASASGTTPPHEASAADNNQQMYTMRMLDNDDAMDTSSDSAVSSMGSSERVPSISDGQEWMETASEGGEGADPRGYYGIECNQTKYRQFSYSYAPGMGPPSHHRSSVDRNGDRRHPPVAQKKYQLFGKRPTVEQAMNGGSPYGSLALGNAAIPTPPIKYPMYENVSSPTYGNLEGATAPTNSIILNDNNRYNCTVDYAPPPPAPPPPNLDQVHHNHTYHMSPEDNGAHQRPSVRDKMKKKSSLEEHLSRDDKRARKMNIPISTEDIVNLPMDEFNERLSKYDLTEAQLTLIRDIRRRGKNKVAAQNCRKRKLDQIIILAEEVQEIQRDREQTLSDQQRLISERQMLKDKYSQLYRHVFQSLRDPDGNPYSPYDYSLQPSGDGSMMMIPRNGTVPTTSNNLSALHLVGSDMSHPSHLDTSNIVVDPNKGAKSKRKEEICRK